MAFLSMLKTSNHTKHISVISAKDTQDEKSCHGCEKSTTKSRASPPKELALREAQKLLYQMASTTQVQATHVAEKKNCCHLCQYFCIVISTLY